MGLPLVRAGSGSSTGMLPNATQLESAMNLATTPEAKVYLLSEFMRVAKECGQTEHPAVTEVITILNENVLLGKQAAIWAGQPPKTPFQLQQDSLVARAAKVLSEGTLVRLILDIALSNTAELLRGYSQEGAPLDEETLAVIDKLFNAWLAQDELVSKGGVIYEGTTEGDPKTDAQGNPIRANATELRQKIPEEFNSYAKKYNFEVTVIDHSEQQFGVGAEQEAGLA